MQQRPTLVVYTLTVAGLFAAIAYGFSTPKTHTDPPLAPFEFNRAAAATPEAAAQSLFRGVATESPTHFVQHILLGVCDGSIDTLQKFAEALHQTEFKQGGNSFSYYELRETRKGINPKSSVRVAAMAPFDTEDEQVAALKSQMMSTYYGQKFVCIDVVAQGYDRLDYQTRIVAAQVGNGWYAMPRCRSARSFYEIADKMQQPLSD